MILQPIPTAEHSRLVHSTNALIDTTYVSQYVQAAALKQLDIFTFSLEQVFSYAIRTVLILKNYRSIDYLEDFKLFILNDIDHLLESDIAERHRTITTHMGVSTIRLADLIHLVMDTIWKIYKVYSHLFCNMFSELSMTCNALGFNNVDFRVHEIKNISHAELMISIGCYA